MRMAKEWLKTWICLSFFLFAQRVQAARPRFDVSTDMGMVLVPADAEVDTAIFRLRATDQDADFPLVFEIIATTSPIVRIENLPCTLYNKVCQANVILTRRLVPGRLHDFVVRVRDSMGDVNSMQATISVTNSTTPRDKIFPHLPSLIMVPEDTKPEKELDYLLVESNPWSGKPVYIELWQPKELFKIRQRQMGSQTKGVITLIGELDFETQSMYTLTMYATDPYTERGKDTRNIAGVNIVVIVQDVQDVPPVFTLAPPLTKINNTVKPGDVILRVHAEDGDKGVPRDVTYGLISEGNPFTPFFNVTETTGEIILTRPLEELTKITHVGAPIVLKIVAEEIRTSRDEPPAQATVVELGLLLGEPGNSPPYFENDNYVAWLDENAEPGTIIMFSDAYTTRVKDEDIGKAGVFALKLENNNGTFEVSPAVAERTANFIITIRDNALIDYEKFKSLRFKIVAQEVGPATNLSTSVPITIFLRDVNDNPPIFDSSVYEITLSENANAGTKVVQVHATDNDAGSFGRIQYTKIIGVGSEAFEINPDSGLITVTMGSVLDREQTPKLELTVEAKDEDGRGLRGITSLIVNILDVNDNAPVFEKGIYEFLLNSELNNFTLPAFIKATDNDAEAPNNIVRYEIVHGNYENKFQLNEENGQLTLREAIAPSRRIRENLEKNLRKQYRHPNAEIIRRKRNSTAINTSSTESPFSSNNLLSNLTEIDLDSKNQSRKRRAEDSPLFILTARAYDLGVPHLSNIAQIRIMRPMSAFARIVMFVMPGENPDPKKTAETLATITGSQVTIQEIKPYVSQIDPSGTDSGKRSVVVARVEQNGPGTLVDVDKIRESLAANGFGILSGMDSDTSIPPTDDNTHVTNNGRHITKNISVIETSNEEVTVYRAENKLLTWLLVLLGLLLLAAIITLIICCICPSCPFYMEPRKRRIHSTETLVMRSDGRPKRHLHRKPIKTVDGCCTERKEAWSADPERQHWQFNRRNTRNLGIASLPGDVVPGHQNIEIERLRRANSLRLRDGGEPAVFGEHVNLQSTAILMPEENERIYMEDMEAQIRGYEQAELDSLRRHEVERGSDGILRNGGIMTAAEAARLDRVREQHFYRDGNAEVLRLITRGEIEDHKEFEERAKELYHANGKDILLQRFIEDQKLRRNQHLRDSFHGSLHEVDVDRSMESHHRINGPQEIIIVPERLELQRQPNYMPKQQQVKRLVTKEDEENKSRRDLQISMRETRIGNEELARSAEILSAKDKNISYGVHDAELVRQNALLTRLLLEKEARDLNVPIVDSSSFLETQSLPGQVAIATQTDRTAATQTEFFGRSRSDNEESEDDPRLRRKSKLHSKFGTKEDIKQMKTIWVTTPIPEESRAQSGKKMTPTRTKIEVTESRKVSISPDVLKEISDSLKSEDEDDEVFMNEETKTKPEKIQKSTTTSSKIVCTSKKKVQDTRAGDDSTTPSPETKEKNPLIKGKIRKKIEKPPRKKFQKTIETEKSKFIEPSFRVLEREISSFQQKIREFGDKKLKMLKKDEVQKDKKESEEDSGATYDVSKKCEITMKKQKRSVSRDNSPTKISVEEKTKLSGEDPQAKEIKTNKSQQNVSSSDIESLGKSKSKSSDIIERTTEFETSKTQTRNRSQLRRQQNLENSDTKSSNEKLEKPEESGSKSEKSKDSLSSSENKNESTSASSNDFNKKHKQFDNDKDRRIQTQEKKCLQSQRIMTRVRPSGVIDVKKKTTSLKTKSVESPVKKTMKNNGKDSTKSLTSDESKMTSPIKSEYPKTSATSEEERSYQETKSSTSKESMAIEFDKFVKDVKGVVEKEISSITEAAKNAFSFSKSDDNKYQSPTKSNKLKTTNSKSHSKSDEIIKKNIELKKAQNKSRTYKSVEYKDKKEKINEQKLKSKSTDHTSPTKSDDAISFIVIENNKSKKFDFSEKNQNLSGMSVHSKSDDDKQESNLILDNNDQEKNTKDYQSKSFKEEVQETKNGILNETHIIETRVSDSAEDIKEKISSKSNEMENETLNDINETLKNINDNIDDVTNDVSDKIEETSEILRDKGNEIKENISETINKAETSLSNEIDETSNNVQDKAEEVKGSISEEMENVKQTLSDKIDETLEIVHEKKYDIEKTSSEKIDEVQQVISDKIEKQTETSLLDNNTNASAIMDTDRAFTPNLDTIKDEESILETNSETNNALSKESTSLPSEITDKNDILKEDDKDLYKETNDTNVCTENELKIAKEYSGKMIEAEQILQNSELQGQIEKVESSENTTKIEDDKVIEAHEVDLSTKESSHLSDLNKDNEALHELSQPTETQESNMDHKQQSDVSSISESTPDKAEETTVETSALSETKDIDKINIDSIHDSKKEKIISEKTESLRESDTLQMPILKITDAKSNDDESDDDSSCISDISNKTALRTKPYSTPRHSISSDGEGANIAESSAADVINKEVKSETKQRQKWNREQDKSSLLSVDSQQQRDSSKAIFPQKIEVTPIGKSKSTENKGASDQTKKQKSPFRDTVASSHLTKSKETKPPEEPEKKEHQELSRRPVIVAVKRKEHLRTEHYSRHVEARKPSPRRDKEYGKNESEKSQQSHAQDRSSKSSKVEIRSKHLKLHVSHHYRHPKDEAGGTVEEKKFEKLVESSAAEESNSSSTARIIDYGKDPEIANARSRYMAWYQQKRAEMEKKRKERKEAEEEHLRPKWLRKPAPRERKAKSAEDPDKHKEEAKQRSRSRERAKSTSDRGESTTPRGGGGGPRVSRLRIRPLVNVESEQLKAIVRQGRKLRKAEGSRRGAAEEDLPVQIFAPDKPPATPSDATALAVTLQVEPRHHLTQHSEYKYEKIVQTMPFYLHPPPPVPHPSPERFQDDSSDSRRLDDDLDSGIAVSLQSGTRLRHQQLLEKKSVFDIAYNEASPTQLRSDSSTPPS